MKASTYAALCAVALALSACGSQPIAQSLGGDLGSAFKDDLVGSETFYSIRRDFRRCIYPLCGGAWVKRLNLTTTVCPDGTVAEECYTPELDLSALGLSEEEAQRFEETLFNGNAIVTGAFESRTYEGFGDLGQFAVSKGFAAAPLEANVAAEGTFYSVKDNGIRCVTHPCFSFDETELNSRFRPRRVSEVNFSSSGATQSEIEKAWDLMFNASLVVQGTNVTVEDAGPAGTGIVLKVRRLFFPVGR